MSRQCEVPASSFRITTRPYGDLATPASLRKVQPTAELPSSAAQLPLWVVSRISRGPTRLAGTENNMFRTAVKWTLGYFYTVVAVIVVAGGARAALTYMGVEGYDYLDLRTELFPICAAILAGFVVCMVIVWFRGDADDGSDFL